MHPNDESKTVDDAADKTAGESCSLPLDSPKFGPQASSLPEESRPQDLSSTAGVAPTGSDLSIQPDGQSISVAASIGVPQLAATVSQVDTVAVGDTAGMAQTTDDLASQARPTNISDNRPSTPPVPVPVLVATEPPAQQLAYSTLLSLLVVFVLILTIRFTVPPLVESLRYAWHHGQLRAEYELSGQQLKSVSLNSLSDASELVSRRVGPSVVHINMLEVLSAPRLFGNKTERVEMVGQGSGVILDTEGHILTNQHVLDDGGVSSDVGRIEVSLSDGRRLIAERIGVDAPTDLAVIKVRADGLMPAEWGDSDKVDVGTPVWAVGSPFGLERTVTFGIISGKHRMNLRGTRWDLPDDKGVERGQATIYRDLMQSDVAVNPGNSGGPLVNARGEIVGINTAILDEHYIGISFAIPSNVARRVAEHLIRDGEVARGWLGVKLTDPVAVADDETGNLNAAVGALVADVVPSVDSPARIAGIQAGDLIVKFNNHAIANYRSLVNRVSQTDVGSTVPVEVMRNGQSIVLNVEIARRK